jgi:outer membrane protein assembly factor BamB
MKLKFVMYSAWLVLGLTVARAAEPVLGSADFRPSPEHPFGFRGDGTGQFAGATPVTEWDEKTKINIRWSTPIGASFSSPILTEKDVIVAAEPNLLYCLSRDAGTVRWKIAITPSLITDRMLNTIATEYEPPKDGAGMMSATPVTDGKVVYVVLANGIVHAVDLDGKAVWTAFIDAEQNTGYGRSASPILCSGKLVVHMTNLYAFDAATGKQLWMNADAPSVYGSPTSLKVDGVDFIVTAHGEVVRANDGKTVASEIGAALHTSPVVSNGNVYFGENAVNAVKLGAAAAGTKIKGTELWTAAIEGDLFGSPLLHDGVLFTVTGKCELIAFDQNGKGEVKPLFEPRKLFGETVATSAIAYSSLTLAGKYFFYCSNAGETVVLDANRDAKQVARNLLPSGSGATPVFSGTEMYFRSRDKLYCIGPKP